MENVGEVVGEAEEAEEWTVVEEEIEGGAVEETKVPMKITVEKWRSGVRQFFRLSILFIINQQNIN